MSISKDDRVILHPDDIPTKWYNIAADLPEPLPPPLNPATNQPMKPEDLEAIFPKGAIAQEMSVDRYIDIPEEVRDAYLMLGRPSPLQRAKRLEKFLKTPAKIYFKREDLSPAGSHKPNSAIPQAYLNMKEGVEHLTTETGAGQWGTALSLACAHFDLECKVFMVRSSYDQKPFRRLVMETYGATVHPSPSDVTEYGRSVLADRPDHPGTLGIAISEAIELCLHQENTKYSLGSVLNHVMLHQTVIGQETMMQLEQIDAVPDYMVACVGGGSNFAGFCFPMMGKKIQGKVETEFIAAEPCSVPSMTKGDFKYDYGDTGKMTPLLKMYTLGCDFVPSAIHAGGLRYHGMAPTVSVAAKLGYIKPVAYEQRDTFGAATIFAKTEGIIPAPESSHAIKAAMDLALEAKKTGEEKVIVFNLSGHGLLDMTGYDRYLRNTL
ncbi:MAG TPA: TrpB-like pyridoxal phosphate-dependent enzyme [Methanomassiliicoccaceae archaeon]|nr:TrpB-like pyridoxal phosphate-dependent enzyme [Methanomassiliicoccaceae archaeon]HOQ25792.1 TrpB-like pyridoxal phosphate-dependent enzyme [Methanomassiliicoccaceae archaeon]HQA21310.1 TrpB-like pyridoxal phosphate-dependent enzyme [Methanomassiliicoccaceae archaeon]HQD88679.1 TrpB-like pyridoxal phosphate-dependent enzyme [Methanomassiliicoccaceae archaeon]